MQIDRQNMIKEHLGDIETYSKKVQDNWGGGEATFMVTWSYQ